MHTDHPKSTNCRQTEMLCCIVWKLYRTPTTFGILHTCCSLTLSHVTRSFAYLHTLAALVHQHRLYLVVEYLMRVSRVRSCSEQRLKSMCLNKTQTNGARQLHISTHGFYWRVPPPTPPVRAGCAEHCAAHRVAAQQLNVVQLIPTALHAMRPWTALGLIASIGVGFQRGEWPSLWLSVVVQWMDECVVFKSVLLRVCVSAATLAAVPSQRRLLVAGRHSGVGPIVPCFLSRAHFWHGGGAGTSCDAIISRANKQAAGPECGVIQATQG